MNIVITGCSQGIGAELVKCWSTNHLVFGISRNREKLEILKSSLENHENFRFISESVNDINQEVIKKSDLVFLEGHLKLCLKFCNLKYHLRNQIIF